MISGLWAATENFTARSKQQLLDITTFVIRGAMAGNRDERQLDFSDLPEQGEVKSPSRKSATAGGSKRTVKKVAKKSTKKRGRRKKHSALPALILLIMALIASVAILGTMLLKQKGVVAFRTDGDVKESSFGNSKSETKKKIKKKVAASSKKNSGTQVADSKSAEKEAGLQDEQQTTSNSTKLKVYYIYFDEAHEKIVYKPLVYSLSVKDKYAGAVRLTLNAPDGTLSSNGLENAFDGSVKLKSVSYNNGIATVDVSGNFLENAYGDIGISRVNQIFLTLTSFSEVKGVIITSGGKKINTTADGLSLSWPLYKKL